MTEETRHFIGVIDGTGPRNDADGNIKYKHVMKGGFCKQITHQLQTSGHIVKYSMGPSNSGSGLSSAVSNITDMCYRHRHRKIILVGYSRGGLGCIMVARNLKTMTDSGVPIWGMVLFDPVDRYFSTSFTNNVPNNVQNSIRFFRRLDGQSVARYDGTMGDFDNRVLNRVEMANPIRPSFGHTCLGEDKGGRYVPHHHPKHWHACSHGAMGGVGYKWVHEDERGQRAVSGELTRWAKRALKLDVRLQPGWDPDIGLKTLSPFVGGVRRKHA